MGRCWLLFARAIMLNRQNDNPNEISAVAQPDLKTLSYLVLDRRTLVAAFAMRDDAEHWIDECGNPAMELREMNTLPSPGQSKRVRTQKSGEKPGGVVARRR
jgi:hypothetical protein